MWWGLGRWGNASENCRIRRSREFQRKEQMWCAKILRLKQAWCVLGKKKKWQFKYDIVSKYYSVVLLDIPVHFFLIPLTALSQVISEDLMVNHFLPGLRCLRTDMEHLSPEHEVSCCDGKVAVIISVHVFQHLLYRLLFLVLWGAVMIPVLIFF